MGFCFDETYNWNKKASQAFLSAAIAVFSIFTTSIGFQDFIIEIILVGFMPVVVAVVQGVYFMNRSNYDYVTLRTDTLSINRGPFIPAKHVDYDDMDYCVEVYDYDKRLIIIKTKHDKEVHLNGEWLSGDDLVLLKKEMVKRTCNEKLFRTCMKTNIL